MRGVINGRIVGDINTYKGIESYSTKVKVNNEKKEIKVDVKDEFIDNKLNNKQDKLIAGENIIIDKNNVISAVVGSPIEAGEGIEITGTDTKTISIDTEDVAMVENLSTVAFSGSYNDLTNKPTIPTATSDLYNDSGYITGITSSMVTNALGYTPYNSSNPSGYITSSALSGYATQYWVGQQGYLTSVTWNDVSGKPTFATVATSGYYNDLINKPTIPTAVSQLNNDSGFISGITSTDVTNALGYTPGTSNFSGDYNDLTNKPIIPDISNLVTTNTYQKIEGRKIITNSEGIQSKSTENGYNYAALNGYSTGEPYVAVQNANYKLTKLIPGKLVTSTSDSTNHFTIKTSSRNHSDTYIEYRFLGPTVTGVSAIKTVATLEDIPTVTEVSGASDGTNWTSITIGNDTYDIPQGGGTEVSGENNGKDWTSLTIDGETYGVANDLNVKIANSRSCTTKTWTGLTNFSGMDVWTDGTNIYYSNSGTQKVLDKTTSTWTNQTWTGLTNFSGRNVWSDEDNIYYSNGLNQYVLNKNTQEWVVKEWLGVSDFTNFIGQYIWKDKDIIYLSKSTAQLVLNKTTSTWSEVVWNISNLDGRYIWIDGNDIYYSNLGTHKILNKTTGEWINKTWINASYLLGNCVWTDGTFIYNSVQVNTSFNHYVLDKDTSTWIQISFTGGGNFEGYHVWTDKEHLYASNGNKQYEILIDIIKTDVLAKVAKTGSFKDLTETESVVNTSTAQLIGGKKVFSSNVYLCDILNPGSGAYIELQREGYPSPHVGLYSSNDAYSYWNSEGMMFYSDDTEETSDMTLRVGYRSSISGVDYKAINYKFIGATTSQASDVTKTVATLDDIPTVSGTNDGTNWTSLTVGEDTYGFASGGDFNITEEDILDEYEDSFIQAEVEIEENDVVFTNDVIITEEDNITINADSTFGTEDSIYL